MINIQEILNNPILGTGLIMTIGGGLIYSLKALPGQAWKIVSKKISAKLVYSVRIYEYDDLFELLEAWLQKNHQKEYKDVEGKLFSPNSEPQAGIKKTPQIYYSQSTNVFILNVNGKRLFITKEREKLEYAQSFKSLYGYIYVIKGFRGKEAITEMLQGIVNEHYDQFPKNQIQIRTNDKYGNWDRANSLTVKGLEKIIIDPGLKTMLMNDIDEFKLSKDWYLETSIPYKRTYAFHGGPGNGKTSICLAIAVYTQRDIYILNPSSLEGDAALQAAFNNIGSDVVLVIEDIDASFTKRDSECNISFSCLLNCTDGAFYKEGLITCITTNHLDKLDPALLRPGRTDMIIEIDFPKVPQIEKFLSIFYKQDICVDCDCENILLSMSSIQEICITNKSNPQSAINTIKSQLLTKPVFI
jgi:hypothetical protein